MALDIYFVFLLNFYRSYVVALLCPDRPALARLADRLGKKGTPEELCQDRYRTIQYSVCLGTKLC